MANYHWRDFNLTDDLVVDAWASAVYHDEYNPHNVRPWLVYTSSGFSAFPAAIVFASCESDALDIAADAGRLDGQLIPEAERDEAERDETAIYLGNASEPFWAESIHLLEMPTPARSWLAEFNRSLSDNA